MLDIYAAQAMNYLQKGWSPIPCHPKTKRIIPRGYTGHQGIAASGADVQAWTEQDAPPDANIALRLPSTVIALDADEYGAKQGQEILNQQQLELGALPPTWRNTSREAGGHYFYRIPDGTLLEEKRVGAGIEVLQRHHRYAIVWPSIHDKTGNTYHWYLPTGEKTIDIPSPEDFPQLPLPWLDFLKKDTTPQTAVDIPLSVAKEWLDRLAGTQPCDATAGVGESFLRRMNNANTTGEARHSIALAATRSLVGMAADGHTGVSDYLTRVKEAFHKAVGPGRETEWANLLAGAVKFEINKDIPALCDCHLVTDVTIRDDYGTPKMDEENRTEIDVTDPDAASEWLRREVGQGALSGLFRRGGRLTLVPQIIEQTFSKSEGDVQELNADQFLAVVRSKYLGKRKKVRYDDQGNRIETQVVTLISKDIAHAAYHGADFAAPNLRNLDGVVGTPILRTDGTALSLPGYDPQTRLLYRPDPGLTVPPWHENPTREQVEAAKETLLAPLQHFPWATPSHQANFLGALFTPLLRVMLPPPYPLVLIEAPESGTGKTLLASILLILYGGVTEGPLPHDKDELRKSVAATLSTTTGAVVLKDNQRGRLQSEFLDMLLTSATISSRILGRSQAHSLNNDRLWVVTSNNATIGGDLHRRILPVALDAQMVNPQYRQFEFNAAEKVRNGRGQILSALLTAAAGWIQAGSPRQQARSDVYGTWRSGIGGLLSWSGLATQFDNQDVVQEIVDPDRDERDYVFQALYRAFPDTPFTATDVIERIVADRPLEGTPAMATHDLPEYIAVEFSRGYHLDLGLVSRKFGYWLRSHRGIRAYGEEDGQVIQLQSFGHQRRGTAWVVSTR